MPPLKRHPTRRNRFPSKLARRLGVLPRTVEEINADGHYDNWRVRVALDRLAADEDSAVVKTPNGRYRLVANDLDGEDVPE
jgi:hypothetical protein